MTTITDEQVAAAFDAWNNVARFHSDMRLAMRAALTAAAQAGKSTESDMRAFGASEAACYHWPEDTAEHKALRAAYCRGAANCGGLREGERVEPSPEPDNNLLHKIRAAQVNVGEQMVLDDLRRRGLLDSPVFECPDCGKDIAEGGPQPHDCRPAPAQSVEGEGRQLVRALRSSADIVNEALNTALRHIEHMAIWIEKLNFGYSFESLGEDMPIIRDALADRTATLTKELAEARKVIDSQQASRS